MGANGYRLVNCDGIPLVHHYWHPCISSHVMHIGPTSPGFEPKEHDDLGIHAHLVVAMFCITFVSIYVVG